MSHKQNRDEEDEKAEFISDDTRVKDTSSNIAEVDDSDDDDSIIEGLNPTSSKPKKFQHSTLIDGVEYETTETGHIVLHGEVNTEQWFTYFNAEMKRRRRDNIPCNCIDKDIIYPQLYCGVCGGKRSNVMTDEQFDDYTGDMNEDEKDEAIKSKNKCCTIL